jgi:hypothetical protein
MLVASLCGFVFVLVFLFDTPNSDFSDLGRKLLGGFAIAVVVAVVLAILYVRKRDNEEPARFISITQPDRADTEGRKAS